MKIEISSLEISDSRKYAYANSENQEEVTTGYYQSKEAAILRAIEMAKAVWGEVEIVEEL